MPTRMTPAKGSQGGRVRRTAPHGQGVEPKCARTADPGGSGAWPHRAECTRRSPRARGQDLGKRAGALVRKRVTDGEPGAAWVPRRRLVQPSRHASSGCHPAPRRAGAPSSSATRVTDVPCSAQRRETPPRRPDEQPTAVKRCGRGPHRPRQTREMPRTAPRTDEDTDPHGPQQAERGRQ